MSTSVIGIKLLTKRLHFSVLFLSNLQLYYLFINLFYSLLPFPYMERIGKVIVFFCQHSILEIMIYLNNFRVLNKKIQLIWYVCSTYDARRLSSIIRHPMSVIHTSFVWCPKQTLTPKLDWNLIMAKCREELCLCTRPPLNSNFVRTKYYPHWHRVCTWIQSGQYNARYLYPKTHDDLLLHYNPLQSNNFKMADLKRLIALIPHLDWNPIGSIYRQVFEPKNTR